jgi:D-glycero-alpha-D-manno-heptose 1-phosphate guanylyltransferase
MSAEVLSEPVSILAGGLGTRLASVLPDLPKVLAPIAGRPFLDILVETLASRGLRRFVLLLGSRHEQVVAHVESRGAEWPAGVSFERSIEPRPLGTGGAVKLAERFCARRFFLVNGDTFFDLDVAALVRSHAQMRPLLTLAAASVGDAGRYGKLDVSDAGLVERFREKDVDAGAGIINAGIYLAEPSLLEHIPAGQPSSLERDVFPKLVAGGRKLAVSVQSGAFFDIGTPSSYASFTEFCQDRQSRRSHEAGGTS